MLSVPMTVVETPGFVRDASAALSDEERAEMIFFLAANPEAGDIIGGNRRRSKVALEGTGTRKSGAVCG